MRSRCGPYAAGSMPSPACLALPPSSKRAAKRFLWRFRRQYGAVLQLALAAAGIAAPTPGGVLTGDHWGAMPIAVVYWTKLGTFMLAYRNQVADEEAAWGRAAPRSLRDGRKRRCTAEGPVLALSPPAFFRPPPSRCAPSCIFRRALSPAEIQTAQGSGAARGPRACGFLHPRRALKFAVAAPSAS